MSICESVRPFVVSVSRDFQFGRNVTCKESAFSPVRHGTGLIYCGLYVAVIHALLFCTNFALHWSSLMLLTVRVTEM